MGILYVKLLRMGASMTNWPGGWVRTTLIYGKNESVLQQLPSA